MMKKQIDIVQALRNPKLFGSLFKSLDTWAAWVVFLKAIFGLAMDPGELELYRKCTGRLYPPVGGFKEAAAIVGRRGGKSRVGALIGVFIGCFYDFKPYLAAGEVGMILILARNRDQAGVVFGYVSGVMQAVPALKQMVVREAGDEIEFNNGIVIKVATSDFRGVRGSTCVCVICDEVAFWNFDSDSANPDTEVLRAVRPAMATIPNAKLILISTGYAMAGALFELHRQHYGKNDSRVLIWQSDTRTMNPNISQEFIDEQIELDPEAGRSEWGGLFREDISMAFPLEMIEQCIIPGRVELAYAKGVSYKSFDDPMGGRGDSWAKCIAHKQGDKVIVDLVRAWPPSIGVHAIAKESAEVGRAYGLKSTVGDNYAGEWPREAFAEHSVTYEQCEQSKSELYLAAIPLMSSRRVELPTNDRMVKEFRHLERKRGRGGKDAIRDGGRHDDVANAVVGAIHLANAGKIFDPRAIPIGVGRGFGYEIRKAIGSSFDQPSPFRDIDDEPPAKVHEVFRFRWGFGGDE
jgi:hypothetical protein